MKINILSGTQKYIIFELSINNCVLSDECMQIDAPVLGSINMTTDGYNSFATFECVQGYKLTHNESLMCKNDGEWEPTKPECSMYLRQFT